MKPDKGHFHGSVPRSHTSIMFILWKYSVCVYLDVWCTDERGEDRRRRDTDGADQETGRTEGSGKH